ncbi:MAG: thiol protease/hemagglutinin PrtT [Bacteroidetes bacterium]|nr:thiol protease/hemagglutinin PrtT [Bacteroidota bacterium]
MKRKITFFASLFTAMFLFCQVSFAEIVSVEKAALVAKNLYYERLNLVKENVSYQSIKFENAIIVSNSSLPMYYVFNTASESGFVVISAESNAFPVLAYSFESKFDVNSLNESVAEYMENFVKEIIAIREKNLTADEETVNAWNKYSATLPIKSGSNITQVGPLTKTTWNQDCFYNTQVPSASGGPCNHAYTGCVATAMAQIMKYWSFPSTGAGSSTTTPVINFASQTYNWNAMPLNLTAENTEVAKVMYHAGMAVNMSYSAGGSSASTQQAAQELMDHFKFSSSAHFEYRTPYSNPAWHILIRSSLIDSKPVMYRGEGTSGGHSFILDGFQYPEHYHINWGWGGSNNGYFYIDNLNSGNGTFNTNQGAIINLYPSTMSGNPLSINENTLSNDLRISPNPNNGKFVLTLNNINKGEFTITVMDITSRVVMKKNIVKNYSIISEEIALAELNNGLYFIAVEGNQYKSVSKFIVK